MSWSCLSWDLAQNLISCFAYLYRILHFAYLFGCFQIILTKKSCGVGSVHQKLWTAEKNCADLTLFPEHNVYFCILFFFSVLKRKWMWRKENYNLVYRKLQIHLHNSICSGFLRKIWASTANCLFLQIHKCLDVYNHIMSYIIFP